MRPVTTRYESSLNSFLTKPFEVGVRHLKVAFCDGSQQTFTEMAKERIIYRSRESENELSPLTKKERFFHLVTGVLETAGYLTIVIPFIVLAVDIIFNKPFYIKGGPLFQTHMKEGGSCDSFHLGNYRENPFDANGKNDLFYQNASWIKD